MKPYFISLCVLVTQLGYSQIDSINQLDKSPKFEVSNNELNNSSIEEVVPTIDPYSSDIFITNKETFLSLCILLSLLIVIAGEIWLIKSNKINFESANKLIIISLVIMCALLVIMGGYDERTIAPAFGLFGTIAGYVLGKSGSENTNKN